MVRWTTWVPFKASSNIRGLSCWYMNRTRSTAGLSIVSERPRKNQNIWWWWRRQRRRRWWWWRMVLILFKAWLIFVHRYHETWPLQTRKILHAWCQVFWWKQPMAIIQCRALVFLDWSSWKLMLWTQRQSFLSFFIFCVFLTILEINESRWWLFARSSSISMRWFTPATTCRMRSSWQEIDKKCNLLWRVDLEKKED